MLRGARLSYWLEIDQRVLATATGKYPTGNREWLVGGSGGAGCSVGCGVGCWVGCVMSIEYPEKNHQEFPGFITRIPGKNYEVGVAVCRMSA